MSLKNLNVLNKTHKNLLNKLKDKRTLEIYNKFKHNLKLKDNFIVAVSGGPDSLALSFLANIYAIENFLKIKFILIDHKLRNNSTDESNFVKNLLRTYSMELMILKWQGKKPKTNIQSEARKKRYQLLIKEAKKNKIQNILFAHHIEDLYENFFIRILRGSGLNGLVSLDEKSKNQRINIIRPLLQFEKKDLVYISNKVFKTFITDPSNYNDKFKRVKIRNFIQNLKLEGLDKEKFNLTIKNLKFANRAIKTLIKKNINENSMFINKKNSLILSEQFFNNPKEVVFRSFVEVIKLVGKKYYPVRGKKVDKILDLININGNFKKTLGNCIIKKINQSVLVSKEH